jgi:ribonuclease D
MSQADLITATQRVTQVARSLAAAGSFALDLEFVSESRYLPELGLVQVAWGDPDEPQVAAIDPLAVDPRPVVELVADPEVETLLHAGQGDLALLAQEFDLVGRALYDSQIGAAFLGIGDQVGYAALVEELVGVEIDKEHQFTPWLRRPLTPEQLAYALDDVRYLPRVWGLLRQQLLARGRLAWVAEETAALAESAARRPAPEEMYQRVGGWQRLQPAQLGALRELAAWRERQAVESNKPPSWLLKNKVLISLARRPPESARELRRVNGIGPPTVRRYGEAILAALERGAQRPLESSEAGGGRPPKEARSLGGELFQHLDALLREADLAPRVVVSRADADALAAWWLDGGRGEEPGLPVLAGWRRRLAGEPALAFLAQRAG